jgi:hypothetical protein
MDGVSHTVEVTAESLYEAIAHGLAALRRSDWVAGFQQVKLMDFTSWLERPGSSPRDVAQRRRILSPAMFGSVQNMDA